MAGFDFEAARRWARFDPGRTLARRRDEALPFLSEEESLAKAPLLLDTCVYIDQMQARAPGAVQRLVAGCIVNHSIVAVQELMYSVGALDPADERTGRVIQAIRSRIEAMAAHRILVADTTTLARSALLAGMIARLQGYGRDAKLRAQQDCILYLQALKSGLTVLTANVREFDLLLQLLPQGRVLFYRTG